MLPRPTAFLLYLTGLCGPALAQLPPLPYVQNLESLAGQTLVLKQVRCQSPGTPETLGRLYLRRGDNGQYRVARYEYNEQGKYVLEHVKAGATGYKYLDRYINQQQPLNLGTLNALLGLWKLFGMHFSLEKAIYSCQVS